MRLLFSPKSICFVFLVCCSIQMIGSREAQAGPCTSAECHAEIIELPKLHSPAESEECDSCHVASEEDVTRHMAKPESFTAFKLPDSEGPFCFECHEKMETGSVVHPPFQDGECLSCHNPHGGQTKFFLKSKQETDLCFECHENTEMVKEFQHSPVADGECTSCHNPHSSNNKSLLKTAADKICFDCHEDKKELLDKSVVHPPLEEDGCLACHVPHSSKAKFLMKSESLIELCFECHEEINPELMKKVKSAKYKHKPVTSGKCTACHDPHASDSEKLLLGTPQTVCLSCHPNIKKELTKPVSKHAPVAKGCAICHEAHGSMNRKLLAKNFTGKFSGKYDSDLYKLCFSCHNKKMLASARANEETKFRDGGTNLHYTHVVKPVNGRSCAVCHEPHGSLQKKLIAKSVAFGKGTMKITIKYAKNDTGGTCVVGCHGPKKYDRVNPQNE